MTNIRDILKKTDYFIKYEYNDLDQAKVIVSWRNEEYRITYIPQDGGVHINNKFVPCIDYAASIITNVFLTTLCETYNYPTRYLILTYNNNIIDQIVFNVGLSKETQEQNFYLNEIFKEVVLSGLKPEHVYTAIQTNVFEGLIDCCRYYLNIEILNPLEDEEEEQNINDNNT